MEGNGDGVEVEATDKIRKEEILLKAPQLFLA
jgi:hypothetical protein